MSMVRTREGAIAGLVAFLVVIVLAVLASRDVAQEEPEPVPSPTFAVEAAVSPPVVVDPEATMPRVELVAYAVPPKADPTPMRVLLAPPPPPEPVAVAQQAPQQAQAATTAPRNAPAAPAPAPAPRQPSEHDQAVALAAQYGCGSVPVIAGGTGGMAGWYSFTEQAIRYQPGDRNLRYLIGHECMHARQQWAYGGDAGTMQHDLASVGGFEKVADCMSQAVGAGSGYYASDCSGDLGRAAAAVLAGQRWGGGS